MKARSNIGALVLFAGVSAALPCGLGACSSTAPQEVPVGVGSRAEAILGCRNFGYGTQPCVADPANLNGADPDWAFKKCLQLLSCGMPTTGDDLTNPSYYSGSHCPTWTSSYDAYGTWFNVYSLASAYMATDPVYSYTSTTPDRCLPKLDASHVYAYFDPNCPGCSAQ
jgi:hypothetical protein